MSGHSKWSNIKRKKEKTDGAKASIFTKFAREIAMAVKEGGGTDPDSNGKLRDCIAKAKANNVPNDNISRAVKKAGADNKSSYERMTYEGYGPSGIAVLIETLTDNKNRTAANIRHHLDKYGAGLGATGCVGYLFTEKGILLLEADGLEEETVMEDAFEAGADDFDSDAEYIEITVTPDKLRELREKLELKGYKFISAEAQFVPSTTVHIEKPEDMKKMSLLISSLEEDEDIQNFWHSMENEEELYL